MERNAAELIVELPPFGSAHDEQVLFEWLNMIGSVSGVQGEGTGIRIGFKRKRISDRDLRELLAAFRRYGLEMAGLRAFETAENREWFNARGKYWYEMVFADRTPRGRKAQRPDRR